jgi:hypothetical protein
MTLAWRQWWWLWARFFVSCPIAQVSLCEYNGCGGLAPRILGLGARKGWSSWRSSRFSPEKRAPGTNRCEVWWDPQQSCHIGGEGKRPCICQNSNSFLAARSPSLYWRNCWTPVLTVLFWTKSYHILENSPPIQSLFFFRLFNSKIMRHYTLQFKIKATVTSFPVGAVSMRGVRRWDDRPEVNITGNHCAGRWMKRSSAPTARLSHLVALGI